MAKLMNWHLLEKTLKDKKILLFSALDVQRLFGTTKIATTFLLHRYAQKGFIIRIKRGLYGFPEALPPEPFIANKLYEPSYLSLDFALSYHRIIPENVYEMTSVTSKATRTFETLGKIYSYRCVKKSVFTGYTVEQQKGYSFFIADAEKAFVDAHYFRMIDRLKPMERLDKKKINRKKALNYAKLFDNPRLVTIIKTLLL